MSDILSGGAIDDSTDGPIPPKIDDRQRDIIAEQKEVQRQDAIGGTAEPPKANPPEQIPEPPQIAPPLPAIPSFGLGVFGSMAENAREFARQATFDVIRNITINGQGPSIEGSNISFNIPQERPASEVFLFQGIAMTQPSPIIANNITDVTVSPIVNAPATTNQATQSVQPNQPTQAREQGGESISDQRNRENSERESRDQALRLSLGLDPVSALSRPSGNVTPRGEPIREQRDRENAEREQRDREIREGIGLDATSSMDVETDVARGFREAEARRKERKENDPNFDRESSIRQRGESPTEFKERQEELKEERERQSQEEEKKSNFIKQAESGIIKEFPSGMIPVRLTRADGKKGILTFLASEFVGVVEGATEGDRPATLPSDDSYYEAGGGGVTGHPFKITSSQNPDNKNQYIVTVGAGTINSLLPSEIFSGSELKKNALSKNTMRYVVLEANSDGEQITSASISLESTAPTPQTPEIFGLPSKADFLIGIVYNSNVYQVVFTNISVTGKQQFITSKSNAGVGELPYEIHYVWG